MKTINIPSGIIGNGHPGSWQPLGIGMVMLLDWSMINRSIIYRLFDNDSIEEITYWPNYECCVDKDYNYWTLKLELIVVL